MWPVSQGFHDAIAAGATLAARAELLNPDLSHLRDLQPEDISVRVQDSIIRRTASLTLTNDGTLTPDPTGEMYFWNPIRTWLGVRVGAAFEWVPTFTGYFDEPEDVASEGSATSGVLTLPCRDRMKLAAESSWGDPFTLGADTRVQDAIRTILEQAGMGADDSLYTLDDGGRVLGMTWTWEADRNRLEAVAMLAQDFALELYCDPMGVVTLTPWTDPNDALTTATYRRGHGAGSVQLLGFRKRWIDRLKNRMTVVGDGGPTIVRVELRDMNRDSPGYNPPPGHPDYPEWPKIGDRADTYRSSAISDAGVAYEVCLQRLTRRGLVEEQISAEVPVDPSHELGDVIEVIDSRTMTEGRWVLDGFDVVHGPSVQILPARRVRTLT